MARLADDDADVLDPAVRRAVRARLLAAGEDVQEALLPAVVDEEHAQPARDERLGQGDQAFIRLIGRDEHEIALVIFCRHPGCLLYDQDGACAMRAQTG